MKSLYSYTKNLYSPIIGIFFLFFSINQSYALPGINETLTFQAKVTNSDGTNTNANCGSSCNFRYRIFSVPTGGTHLWQEVQTGVNLYDGILSTNLGSINPFGTSIDWNDDSLYLELAMDANAIGGDGPDSDGYEEVFDSPRIRLTSVPYAFNSKFIGGYDSDDLLKSRESDSFEGNNDQTLSIVSDLSTGNRLDPVFSIIQGDSASGSLLGNLVDISQNDSDSTGTVLGINNQGTGLSLRVNDELNDTTPFVVDADGRVGIGVLAPASRLEIVKGAGSDDILRIINGVDEIFAIRSDGTIDFNNVPAHNFRIENSAIAPLCNIASVGRQYYDSANGRGYICIEDSPAIYVWYNFTSGIGKYEFAGAPTVNDDNTQGFVNGTIWIDTTSDNIFIMADSSTGSAVWKSVGGTSNLASSLPAVQVRRTTDFAMAALTTWYDIPFDSTDVENDPAVIEHNNVNTERVDIKSDGLYQISYHLNANDGGGTHEIRSRVMRNSLIELEGSSLVGRNYQNEYSPTVTTFFAVLSDGDYITLQAQRATANTIINETMFNIVKLDGVKGDKGDKGDPAAPAINANVNPTINDDITLGYENGTLWVNNLTEDVFVLIDSTAGSALWQSILSSSSGGQELAATQVRRTTDFAMAALTTWYDIPFDSTDVENDPAVIEHNNVNTERVDIKSDGLYQISYHLNANDGGGTHEIRSRVMRNSLTELEGSSLVGRNYQNEYSPTVTTFFAVLSDGDYITLQAQRATANTIINETMLNIVKLDGVKGDKGDKGDPGDPGTASFEDIYTNDTDKTLSVSDTLGFSIVNSSTGNITISNQSTGKFVIQGDIRLDDLIDCYRLTTDVNGNVTCGGSSSSSSNLQHVASYDTDEALQSVGATIVTLGTVSITPATNTADVYVTGFAEVRTNNNTDQSFNLSIRNTNNCTGSVVGNADVTYLVTTNTGGGGSNLHLGNIRVSGVDIDPGSVSQNYSLCASTPTGSTNVLNWGIEALVIDSGADLAELYTTFDNNLTAGYIVSVDNRLRTGVKKSESELDHKVIGVVATRPGIIIGSVDKEGITAVPVALSGRVPVLISPDSDNISVGDYITSSSIAGLGQKATRPGVVVGKALENWTKGSGQKTVMVFVGVESYYPNDGKIYTDLAPVENPEFNELTGEFEGGISIGNKEEYLNNVYTATLSAMSSKIANHNLSQSFKIIDSSIVAGDVVASFYGSEPFIGKTGSRYDNRVMGVVATSPGVILSKWESIENTRPLALSGSVPVKISTENGDIEPGDRLVPASTPGYAMKACGIKYCEPAISIGIALEPFTNSNAGDSGSVQENLEKTQKIIQEDVEVITNALETQVEVAKQGNDHDLVARVEEDISKLSQIEEVTSLLVERKQESGVGYGRIMMQVNLSYVGLFGNFENNLTDQESNAVIIQSDSIGDYLQGKMEGNISMSRIVLEDNIEFQGQVKIVGHIGFGEDTLGQLFVPRGEAIARVQFTNEYSNIPLVFIQPMSSMVGYEIDNITTKGFDVRIVPAIDIDLYMNWMAFDPNLKFKEVTKRVSVVDSFDVEESGSVDRRESEQEDDLDSEPSGDDLLDSLDGSGELSDGVVESNEVEIEEEEVEVAKEEEIPQEDIEELDDREIVETENQDL
jgi:hypothetical protein